MKATGVHRESARVSIFSVNCCGGHGACLRRSLQSTYLEHRWLALLPHTSSAVQQTPPIRADLLLGSIAPDHKLHIVDLSQRYGTSPSAIREALSRLVAERLITVEEEEQRITVDEQRIYDKYIIFLRKDDYRRLVLTFVFLTVFFLPARGIRSPAIIKFVASDM